MGARGGKKKRRVATGRTRTVWLALLGAMTFTGGGMWALQGAPMPRLDGMSLPALVSTAGPSSLETVYQTRAAIEKGRWTSIVIHHSGASYGTPASIEAEHRAMNLAGLGYHFVIGNGHGIGDGEVHAGYRWLDQLPGAHVAGPRGDQLNRTSIGICLVGDGQRHEFTPEQMTRLLDLVATLRDTLDIPASQVFLHSDVAATADPGLMFPAAAFREQVASMR